MQLDWNELLNFSEYLKLTIGLFAIAEPTSTVPVLMALTSGASVRLRLLIVTVTTLVFIVFLSVFALFGVQILGAFRISVDAFRVAGGILLLILGLEMMRNPIEENDVQRTRVSWLLGVIPLGIPLSAGPGALGTILVYGNMGHGFSHIIVLLLVILIVGLLLWLTLIAAPLLERVLGGPGTVALNRVMGVILAAIGMEFILSGLGGYIAANMGVGN